MSKYNTRGATRYTHAPGLVPAIKTEVMASGTTFEGAPGYARDTKSELFLLSVSLFAGEPSFYETKDERTGRFIQLVRTVAVADPDWTGRFLRWLRTDVYIRTASVVGAIEAADAMVKAKIPGSRTIVDSVLQRPDEPGEAIAYWRATYGRRQLPKPIKRGIADAVGRLFTEFSWLKWDSTKSGVRFADVIELVHPGADHFYQMSLFPWILDSRHGRKVTPTATQEQLPMIMANRTLRERVAGGDFTQLTNAAELRAAGMTWEDALSLAGPRVSKKDLWEAMIPNMGYMAILRNLRNFDQAGISPASITRVVTKLTNPAEVAGSKQFPFRFLAAYRAVESLRWGPALEEALNLSLQNVPVLQGRTLVLVDRSGSMFNMVSEKSGLNRADQAAVFGSALKLRDVNNVDLVEFGDTHRVVNLNPGESLLRAVDTKYHSLGGTYTRAAVAGNFKGHNRVIIVTDEQSAAGNAGNVVPASVPIYTWNLAGYRLTSTAGTPNRFTFAGMTDQAFSMIPLMEAGASQQWPF